MKWDNSIGYIFNIREQESQFSFSQFTTNFNYQVPDWEYVLMKLEKGTVGRYNIISVDEDIERSFGLWAVFPSNYWAMFHPYGMTWNKEYILNEWLYSRLQIRRRKIFDNYYNY